jgi:hypothetical protein
MTCRRLRGTLGTCGHHSKQTHRSVSNARIHDSCQWLSMTSLGLPQHLSPAVLSCNRWVLRHAFSLTDMASHCTASVVPLACMCETAWRDCPYQGQLLCWLAGVLAGQSGLTPSHLASDWQGVRDGLQAALHSWGQYGSFHGALKHSTAPDASQHVARQHEQAQWNGVGSCIPSRRVYQEVRCT